MKRKNGYLYEEFPGELESSDFSIPKNSGKVKIKDLKNQGFSDEEIMRLIIEAE